MINLAAIKDLLLPGLRGIEGQYEQIEQQWDKVYARGNSSMALERTVEARYLGLAKIKSEGGAVRMDSTAGQRYIYNQEHTELGLGYAITRKAIEDNLYKSQFDPTNLGLMDAFRQTKEIQGAALFNSGTTFDSTIVGDGVALFATTHPYDNGTWANKPTNEVDLSEGALETAQTSIRYYPDLAGRRIMARGRKLVIPPQLKYTAVRLLQSELRPGTAANDVNAIRWGNDYSEGFQVMDFLTSNFAWFIKTDKPGLLYLSRRPFETDMQVDFTTQNLLVIATERYSFGYFNPRAVYGTFPTS